jgi:hypothetical protein
MFLELSKLESKKIRLQVLQLVDALESEALDVFRLARRLERKLWNDPARLKSHGRAEIVQHLRAKFASEHVDLALVDTLDEQLDPLPAHWYRQGGLLLDCAEALNVHVAAYEYQLVNRRRHDGGRAPSVAHDYLAAEQQRFGKSDEQVTQSLVDVGWLWIFFGSRDELLFKALPKIFMGAQLNIYSIQTTPVQATGRGISDVWDGPRRTP